MTRTLVPAVRIRRPLAALSFWAAIAVPALYVPLLLDGIESLEGLGLFLGLFGLHALALLGGRRYHEEQT